LRNIGVEVVPPETECTDAKCPFHGSLSIRGQIIQGVVKSASMKGTAVVLSERRRRIPKYERYESRVSQYHAHVPACITVQPGSKVKIAECRKLAKTVSYVVIEKVTS
jgi:small subunit ribosomal protein S17